MMNKGYVFEAEVGKSLKEHGVWYKKMSDTESYQKSVVCPMCKSKFTPMYMTILPKAVADYIIVVDGGVVFLECKKSIAAKFPIRNIKKHQWEWGLELSQYRGTNYFYAINDRRFRGMFRTTVISAKALKEVVDELGANTVPWDILHDAGMPFIRREGGRWDMSRWLRTLDVDGLHYDEVEEW